MPNAPWKIISSMFGIWVMFSRTTSRPSSRYSSAIIGTSHSVTEEIARIPPKIMAAVSSTMTAPTTMRKPMEFVPDTSMPREFEVASTTALVCTATNTNA